MRIDGQEIVERVGRLAQAAHFRETQPELHVTSRLAGPEPDDRLEFFDGLVEASRVLQGFAEQQPRAIVIGRPVHRFAPERDRTRPERISRDGLHAQRSETNHQQRSRSQPHARARTKGPADRRAGRKEHAAARQVNAMFRHRFALVEHNQDG